MKNKAAQEMARKRAESMTAERRREVASKAGKARWAKRGANNPDVGTEMPMVMLTKKVTLRGLAKEYPEPPKVAVRCSGHKAVNCGRCGG